tara:strand:+ start:734 stop:1102 length:369 start_codon:yes stop_codon:yes gene_type:complete
MKIYELREDTQPCSSWYATKAEALKALKYAKSENAKDMLVHQSPEKEIKLDTWEIDNTRAGIVEMLNQIALRELFHPDHDEPETRTVIRKTASKPPEPMSQEDIDKLEKWDRAHDEYAIRED